MWILRGRLSPFSLIIVAALCLAGCTRPAQSGPTISTTTTTSCPDATGPISAPIVAAAGSNLIATDADGGIPNWLLSLSQEATAAFPAWSPDGQTLAYALRYPAPSPQRRGIISVICGLDRVTGEGRLLAAGGQDDWLDEPVWSPDGRLLWLTLNRFQLSAAQQPVDQRNVARYDLATEELQVVIPNAHSPAVSSKGDRLVYVAAEPRSGVEVLFVARPDGQDARQLIALQRPYVSAMWPRWSPDDSQILFGVGFVAGEEDERYVPCVVDADGKEFHQLSKDVNNVVSVDWGPESEMVYVSSGKGLFIHRMGEAQARNIIQAGDGMGVSWVRR